MGILDAVNRLRKIKGMAEEYKYGSTGSKLLK